MKHLKFDHSRPFDLILLGRVAIDFNPAPTEDFKPLKNVDHFIKYVGGSPANIACGVTKHGLKAGFIGKVSDDQFGDYVTEYFKDKGIDTSHISRCTNGEKLGLTFTEMLSPTQSRLLMYRNCIADLQLSTEDVDEEYIKQGKMLLISGTALAESPSREATLKALMLAIKSSTPILFDIDYRPYNWINDDVISIYYSYVARNADIIMGSRREFDLMQRLINPDMNDSDSANYWLKQKAKIVVIKHGTKGSCAFLKNGEHYSIRPFPVQSRKGFGGGDGYASGFLYGIYQGWPIIDCLEFGSAEASMMVRSNNSSDDLPTTQEVKDFIYKAKKQYGEMVARM